MGKTPIQDVYIHLYSECVVEYSKLTYEECMEVSDKLLIETRKSKVRELAVNQVMRDKLTKGEK